MSAVSAFAAAVLQSGSGPAILRPVIRAKYHVVPVPGDGVFLLGENEKHVLEGESLFRVVPLLDGQRTWDDVHAALAPALGTDAVLEACTVLVRHGHVEEAAAFPPPAYRVFWSELGLDPGRAAMLVATTNVHLARFGEVDTAAFEQGLLAYGFRRDPGAPASVTVAVADDPQNPGLAQLNAHALAHGVPWLLVKPQGLVPLIGPFFRPGRTACWACLEARLRHNREVEGYVQRKLGRTDPFALTRARVPLGETQAASLALLQLVRWLALGANPAFESRILSLDVMTGEQRSHLVVRRPQCSACGDPALARVAGRPVVLGDPALRVRNENGLRAEEPDVTFARYANHVSELTGVVNSVHPAPFHGVGPLRTYVAGHNFALKNDGLYFLKDGLRSSSSGKGRTDAQARTSALCEALERFSGLHRGEEERELASFVELEEHAVDPRRVLLFSETQYAEREAWLARGSRFQVVPRPFDERARLSWSPVWSWTQRRRKLLPTSLLYYGFVDSEETFFCWGDSNGAAAGSCIEDALLQGALELVERDGVAIWWYNTLRRPALDLGSLDDPYVDELQAFYSGVGRELWVLDLTADLGVPCVAAINRRVEGPTEDIVMGFGAHLDPRIAVSRALTEMNQFMPAVLSVGEDGETRYAFQDPDSLRWWQTARLADQAHLRPADGPRKAIGDMPALAGEGVRSQLLDLFGRFEAQGLEVLILDQTRPDVGLPVVKVIVPGLRHFWARYAPGRLYDVPVQMGWLDEPTPEAALNPVAMFV